MGYLNEYDVLHQSQSGFRSGHSTETALTLMTEHWFKAINDGNIVHNIMFRFDLLKQVGLYKCSEECIKFMKSYLSQRTHK